MKYFISYNGKVGLGHFFGCIDVSLNKLTVNNTDEWFKAVEYKILKRLEEHKIKAEKIIILNYKEIPEQ